MYGKAGTTACTLADPKEYLKEQVGRRGRELNRADPIAISHPESTLKTSPVVLPAQEGASGRANGDGVIVRRTVLTSDGVELAVRDFHSRAATDHTVVLVHGFCLSQTSWNLQIRQLRRWCGERVRVISYDHRGHGLSGGARVATYRIDQLAMDLRNVLETLGVGGPVTLAGHSMGAMTLLAYLGLPAAERVVNPDGLVLVAGAAGQLCERGVGRLLAAPALGLLAEVLERAPHRAAERAVRAIMLPVCEALSRVRGCPTTERHTLVSTVTDAVGRTPLTTAAGFLSSLKCFDAYATLPSITARTAVISGGLDVVTPPAHARDLVAGISGARGVTVATAGHMLLHEAANVVSETIASVIRPRRLAASARRDALGA